MTDEPETEEGADMEKEIVCDCGRFAQGSHEEVER
jgi:hypothetical protein